MAKIDIDEAFHQIIKNIWHCFHSYNQGVSKQGLVNGLTTIKEQLDTLIHSIQNT